MVRSAARIALSAGLAIAAVLAFTLPGSISSAAEFKMGVVDPQEVLEKSKAGRRALDALKEYAVTRQKVIASDEEELKSLEKQLKEQESSLSEAQKREKQNQFRTKLQEYQRRTQEFNQELAGKQKELVDDYMKRIGVATRTIAERGGFSIVVDKGSDNTIRIVLYNKGVLDLTDQVTKEFDRVNK